MDLTQSVCIAEDADSGRYLAYVLKAETYSEKEPLMVCMGNSITTGEPYLRSCLVELVA